MWWFLPSSLCIDFHSSVLVDSDVGENTQGRIYYVLSFSPLSVFFVLFICLHFTVSCRGDSQGSLLYTTLVLPSLNRK